MWRLTFFFYTNLLVFVSGKTTAGVKFLASSKSMDAYDIIITMSPTTAFLAAGPLRHIHPEPLSPFMAYVSRRSPLLISTTCTFSFGIMLAASIRASSMVIEPMYSKLASVTVTRWIFDFSISMFISLLKEDVVYKSGFAVVYGDANYSVDGFVRFYRL